MWANCLHLFSQDDSILYVKTTYEFIIENGASLDKNKTARKIEMRNSSDELFREVFYNKETKQIDYILYYYYNNDNSIRLIEKVNNKEDVFEYSKYKYKKGKLIQTSTYSFDHIKSTATLAHYKKYQYKKGNIFISSFDNKNKLEKKTEQFFNGDTLISKITSNLKATDSTHTIIENFQYLNGLLHKKETLYITSVSDTIKYLDTYNYNKDGKNDLIHTYAGENTKTPVYQTKFQFTPNGSVKDIQKTIGGYPYLKHIRIDFKKYKRGIHYRGPITDSIN